MLRALLAALSLCIAAGTAAQPPSEPTAKKPAAAKPAAKAPRAIPGGRPAWAELTAEQQQREHKAQHRFCRRHVHEANAPRAHRERLPAAQPAPQEVSGEHDDDEKLQLGAHDAARGVAAAAREEEQPRSEETDGEDQKRFVGHGREAAT